MRADWDMTSYRNIVIRQRVDPDKIGLAKELRKNPTRAERILWGAVRRNQVDGLHFRRQQIIGGFIVDFYCHRARLAIEVDGNVHDDRVDYDMARDAALCRVDVRVARFSNDDVLDRLDDVIARIRNLCSI